MDHRRYTCKLLKSFNHLCCGMQLQKLIYKSGCIKEIGMALNAWSTVVKPFHAFYLRLFQPVSYSVKETRNRKSAIADKRINDNFIIKTWARVIIIIMSDNDVRLTGGQWCE